MTINKSISASSLWRQDKQEDLQLPWKLWLVSRSLTPWLHGGCCLWWILASGERDGKGRHQVAMGEAWVAKQRWRDTNGERGRGGDCDSLSTCGRATAGGLKTRKNKGTD